jgi:hypothetical protein
MSITDEQLQAIRREWYDSYTMPEVRVLFQAIAERDTSIADLEQAVADSAVEIGRLNSKLEGARNDATSYQLQRDQAQSEVEQLRKPVAVESSGLLSVLRAVWADEIKEAKDHPERFPAGQSIVVIAYLFDQVDALDQNAAAMRNAHDVLMAEMRGLRERLDYASGLVTTQEGKILGLEERERRLREALERIARPVGHIDLIVGIARAALSQPQEPNNGTV